MNKIDEIKNTFDSIYNTASVSHVFIRIPKTGTQSMNLAIKQKWDHYSAQFCKDHLGDKWDNTFSFSIVRNPWSRMYSFFKYHKQNSNHERHKIYRSYDFESWVLDGFPHHYNKPHQKILFPNNPHIQFDWVSENDQIIVDHIIKLENLRADSRLVAQKLKIPILMPHINKSASRDEYLQKYNDRTIEAVAEFCAKDIEAFGYSYGEK